MGAIKVVLDEIFVRGGVRYAYVRPIHATGMGDSKLGKPTDFGIPVGFKAKAGDKMNLILENQA